MTRKRLYEYPKESSNNEIMTILSEIKSHLNSKYLKLYYIL